MLCLIYQAPVHPRRRIGFAMPRCNAKTRILEERTLRLRPTRSAMPWNSMVRACACHGVEADRIARLSQWRRVHSLRAAAQLRERLDAAVLGVDPRLRDHHWRGLC